MKIELHKFSLYEFSVCVSTIGLFVLFIDTYINVYATSDIYDVIQFASVFAFGLAYLTGPKKFVKPVGLLLMSIIIFVILYYLGFYSESPFCQKILQLFMTLLPLPLSLFWFDMSFSFKRVAIIILYGLILTTCITTINALIDFPYASKMMANSRFDGGNYNALNVGGYQFVYMLVGVTPITCLQVINREKLFLHVPFLILIGLTIFMSQYVVASLVFVLVVSYYFFLAKQKKENAIAVLVIVFIIFLVLRSIWIDALLYLVDSLPDNFSVSSQRILSMATMLSGTDDVGDASFRLDLYWRSIQAFFWSAFMGNWILNSGYTIGGHSAIFDLMGGMGMIGFFIFSYIITLFYKSVKNYDNRMISGTMIVTLAVFLVNTSFGFPMLFAPFSLIPAILYNAKTYVFFK